MMLNNIRLAPRLFGAFFLMAALLIATVAFALHRLTIQNESLQHLVNVETEALLALGRLERLYPALGVSLRDSILADNGEVVRASLAAVERALDDTRQATRQAESLTSEGASTDWQALTSMQTPCLAQLRQLAATVRQGDNDAAREAVISERTRKTCSAYADALSSAVASQRTATAEAQSAGQAAFATSRLVMLVLAAGATALAAVIGMTISRSVLLPARQAAASARRIADGDLSTDLAIEGRDEMAELLGAMQDMQRGLRRTVGDIRQGAAEVSRAVAEIAQGNQDLSTRTVHQSGDLQHTAAAMQQMGTTIKLSADAAIQANQLAAQACAVAARGGSAVAQVVSTMAEINAGSKRINDIIGTIDGIAFETNLLALNAAVEAARAGEQGRGFAVVASQVRTLAQSSADAAREIKGLIGHSVDKVGQGAQLVQNAGATMTEIVGSVEKVSTMIAEINATTGEQAAGIEAVNDAVIRLDAVTRQNANLVQQSAASASSLNEQARRLLAIVDTFRLRAQDAKGA